MRGWRWLAPAVVVLLALTAWPLARAVQLSLSTYSLTDPDGRRTTGLDAYADVLGSRSWWVAVAATLVIVAGLVVAQVALGLVLASALRRLWAAWPVTRILLLVPFAMLSVCSAVLWRDAVTTGFAASWFRLDGVGPLGALTATLLGEVWRGTGITTVILLAGLDRVPASLLRSAAADGATAWQRLRRVILPAMGPALAVAVAYRAFDALRLLEGPLIADDPTAPVRTVPLLIWTADFSAFEVGLGATMSVLLVVLAGLLAAVLLPMLRMLRMRRVV